MPKRIYKEYSMSSNQFPIKKINTINVPSDHLDIIITLDEFYEDCKANGMSFRTIQSYQSSLRAWQTFLNERGITSLTEITSEILLHFRHYLQGSYRSRKGKPLAISTMAQKLVALRTYLYFCVRTGKILLNVAHQLPYPKLPKSLPRGILSKQQMKRLLRLPDTKTLVGFRDRVILELFYSTGVRRNELVSIRLLDCQLSERRIFIREGKGGKQRWVPIGKKVCEILRSYVEHIRPALAAGQSHDYLLVGSKGGKLYATIVYTIVKGYLKQLGLHSDCHGLRHTCATHLLKGKANIRVIQSLLGHSSLSSTQIYTHVDISDMAKAIEKAHPRETMQCDTP